MNVQCNWLKSNLRRDSEEFHEVGVLTKGNRKILFVLEGYKTNSTESFKRKTSGNQPRLARKDCVTNLKSAFAGGVGLVVGTP